MSATSTAEPPRFSCRSLSDSMEQGTILHWLIDDGEQVAPATSWSRSRPTRRP